MEKNETNMVQLRRNHVQREISWAPHVGNRRTLIQLVVEDQILVLAPLFAIHRTLLKFCFLVRKPGWTLTTPQVCYWVDEVKESANPW